MLDSGAPSDSFRSSDKPWFASLAKTSLDAPGRSLHSLLAVLASFSFVDLPSMAIPLEEGEDLVRALVE